MIDAARLILRFMSGRLLSSDFQDRQNYRRIQHHCHRYADWLDWDLFPDSAILSWSTKSLNQGWQMPVKSCVDLEIVADSSSPADRSVHTPLFSFPGASFPSDVVVYSYFVVMTLSAAVRCPITAQSSDWTNIHTGKHWHSNEGIRFGHFRE